MKIKKVTQKLERVWNMGNYESIRYATEMEAVIEEEDDIEKVTRILRKKLKKEIDIVEKMIEDDLL